MNLQAGLDTWDGFSGIDRGPIRVERIRLKV